MDKNEILKEMERWYLDTLKEDREISDYMP